MIPARKTFYVYIIKFDLFSSLHLAVRNLKKNKIKAFTLLKLTIILDVFLKYKTACLHFNL